MVRGVAPVTMDMRPGKESDGFEVLAFTKLTPVLGQRGEVGAIGIAIVYAGDAARTVEIIDRMHAVNTDEQDVADIAVVPVVVVLSARTRDERET